MADAPDCMTAEMITVSLRGMKASHCTGGFTERNWRGQVFNPSTRNGDNIPSTSHFQSSYCTSYHYAAGNLSRQQNCDKMTLTFTRTKSKAVLCTHCQYSGLDSLKLENKSLEKTWRTHSDPLHSNERAKRKWSLLWYLALRHNVVKHQHIGSLYPRRIA